MANPTQAQIDKLTTNLTNWDSIVNGAAGATVSLDSHTVKTVTGYLQELASLTPQGAWATSTAYVLKDVVVESSTVYICVVAHTSGTFATDLSAGKWVIYQLDVTSAITFTSDFTVDTDVFHVDATNDRVGIGTASPGNLLHLEYTSTSLDAMLKIKNLGTGDAAVQISTSATDLMFGLDNSDSDNFKLGWGTALSSLDTVVITPGGNVGIGTSTPAKDLDVSGEGRFSTGILFGSDTAAANTLDDYEEGTFTPTITNAGAYTTQFGVYTKIGRLVIVHLKLHATSVTQDATTVVISGLPFTGENTSDVQQRSSGVVEGDWTGFGSVFNLVRFRISGNTLVGVKDNGSGSAVVLPHTDLGTSVEFHTTVMYYVAT